MSKVIININGKQIVTEAGRKVLEVALENNINIPHLCADERLEAYGGCSLCMIEIEGVPKLARACATQVSDGMIVRTNTDRIIESRKIALSLIASDHRGDCKAPCRQACPAHTDVQGYVGLVANGQYKEAIKLIKDKIAIPASIGRVCPHPCEKDCRRQYVEEPISIAGIKTYAADKDLSDEQPYMPSVKPNSGKTVAVVGAGAAGLAAAYNLARLGHSVEVFEAMKKPGGMLRYGIPEYRLPKTVIDEEVGLIEKLGVKFTYGVKVGEDVTLDYLKKQYDAVFLGIGAWKSSSMRCEGENTPGVIGGIDFLIKVAQNESVNIGKKVIVVGGGNTAMDVARTCARLGVDEVRVVYRRDEESMPAEKIEIKEAKEEGVIFSFLNAPTKVMSDGEKVTGLMCDVMTLGEKDASGRRSPVPTGETTTFEANIIIVAIGQQVTLGNINVAQTKKHTIEVNEDTFETNIEGVFAGGDAVSGPKIAIEAIAQANKASVVIDSYLNGEILPYQELPVIVQKDFDASTLADREKKARVEQHTISPVIRKTYFQPVAPTMTEEEAIKEAKRCLECGCKEYYNCQLIRYIQEYGVDTEKYDKTKSRKHISSDHKFLIHNQEKCIICNLCVRTCDEIVGQSVLGLVDRGFVTTVAPEFELPLSQTSCISCGQCADVCPTGAWLEKYSCVKEVPLNLEFTKSVCGFCSVGCELNYEHNGNIVYRASNVAGRENNLCAKGKFGFDYLNNKDRILKPLVKLNGKFENVSFDAALFEIAKRLRTVQNLNKENSIAFVVSPKLTNEELKVIKSIANELNTNLLSSFTIENEKGIEEVFGSQVTGVTIDDMNNSDLVIAVGRIYENHPATGMRIKKVSKKTKVLSVSENGTKTDTWSTKIHVNNYEVFAAQVLKAIIDSGKVEYDGAEFETLKDSLESLKVTEQAQMVADAYLKAKKPMIITDTCSVQAEAIKALADTVVVTNNAYKQQRGILVLQQKCNSVGAWDIGFRTSGQTIKTMMKEDKVKAVVVIGEDVAGVDSEFGDLLKKMIFSAVFDIFETETSKGAEFIIPLAGTPECGGHMISFDGTVRNVVQATTPVTGMTNLEMLTTIAGHMNAKQDDSFGELVEGKLYIPQLKSENKKYVVYDTVEKQFMDRL